MPQIIYLRFALAALLIVLSFIALLKQKTYLDSETGDPTEVEITGIGKMRTNYPALLFLVVAVVVLFYPIKYNASLTVNLEPKILDETKPIMDKLLVTHNDDIVDVSDGRDVITVNDLDSLYISLSEIVEEVRSVKSTNANTVSLLMRNDGFSNLSGGSE